MLQSLKSRGGHLADGHIWNFVNDIRLVGELTKVVRTVATGALLEGWATITAYRSQMTRGAISGMCVVGPVFQTAKRGKVIDLQPIFCRLESIMPSVVSGSYTGTAKSL